MFAARAGAARVYAVERTTVAVLAWELAAANGFADIVRVIHGDVTDVELSERVDVIVSEWLGGSGSTKGCSLQVVRARVRTALVHPIGTWTSWAIAMPGADREEHDERSVWEEIDD